MNDEEFEREIFLGALVRVTFAAAFMCLYVMLIKEKFPWLITNNFTAINIILHCFVSFCIGWRIMR